MGERYDNAQAVCEFLDRVASPELRAVLDLFALQWANTMIDRREPPDSPGGLDMAVAMRHAKWRKDSGTLENLLRDLADGCLHYEPEPAVDEGSEAEHDTV